MGNSDSQTVQNARQYLEQFKGQYAEGELVKKLSEAGYSESVIAEARRQMNSGQSAPTPPELVSSQSFSTGKKILHFLGGFFLVGAIFYAASFVLYPIRLIIPYPFFNYSSFMLLVLQILVIAGFIWLYFRWRRSKKYIARGILVALILSVVAIILIFVVLGFLFFAFRF